MLRVPVLHKDSSPLMPCKPAKARKLLRDGKAVKRWTKEGVFYIQLTWDTTKHTQPMCLGIDPGAKFDGYAVLTDQEIVTSGMAILPDIRKKVETRRMLRRNRRGRKNRRRQPRPKDTKKQGWISPTQRAKVEFRLVLVSRYLKLYPITHFAVEDVRFNHYKNRWGKYFSTVEIGKTKLYTELEKCGKLYKFPGYRTKELRDRAGLKKSSSKDKLSFDSHAVDAAVIAAEVVGYTGDFSVKEFWVFKRPNLRRRSLHVMNPQKDGVRRVHGGTWAFSIRKNTVCIWKGKVYRTGGSTKGRLSLHDMSLSAKRVTQNARVEDLTLLYHQTIYAERIA